MDTLTILLFILLVVKICWIIATSALHLLQHDIILHNSDWLKQVEIIEDILHLSFTFCIGILLIYLFHHLTPARVCIEGHEKMYLYAFGILSAFGSIKKMAYYFNRNT